MCLFIRMSWLYTVWSKRGAQSVDSFVFLVSDVAVLDSDAEVFLGSLVSVAWPLDFPA